jgi:toxin ParE1/3/4
MSTGKPARYRVVLTHGAADDLSAIHAYIARQDGPARADALLDQVLSVSERLSHLPDRGSVPRELAALGIREFRQVLLGPYRLFYRVDGDQVIVSLIVDGRRDLPSLLAERLLRS